MAGRGCGKTRTGSEATIEEARNHPKSRITLVSRTAADIRSVMLYGPSGILTVSPPWFRPKHNPSKRLLTWPNGSMAETFSADEPDSLRGQNSSFAWADEPAAWRFPDAWDQLLLGLRIGEDPRVIATTTPRPTDFIRRLVKQPTTRLVRGKTSDNYENLAPAFIEQIMARYEGTRLGRQELDGDILDDAPGALFKRPQIDELRVREIPEIRRVVLAIDPAFSTREEADETGIVIAGLGRDGHGYVLDDLSGRYELAEWARIAVKEYQVRRLDRVIAEMNLNGQMVEKTLKSYDRNLSFRGVRAYRGKELRAEPVAALYEQGKVHHVGSLATLEDQMCGWEPGVSQESPDRLDALVYALTDLMVDRNPETSKTAGAIGSGSSFDERGIGI